MKIAKPACDKMQKECQRRNRQHNVRKLFSIYKFKISAQVAGSKSSMTKSSSPSSSNFSAESTGVRFQELVDELGAGKYTSCMHFYKRDLTPVKENFASINPKTPYRQSFENYDINVLTKDFKAGLQSSLGSGVKCQSNAGSDKRITTFSATTETPLLQAQRNDIEKPPAKLTETHGNTTVNAMMKARLTSRRPPT